ncbi:C40 family peptidase [Vibrio rotiferianus]|uniref:C40 family peptidase n=1 Tax=Vibrio rotiferianus TaxID=190895 RepID=UPI00148E1AE5|nr:NlpC/P60 family protein [Vibrio rotiferianus]NOH65573.1 hydrolase [Vibrio rotiferianus]
MRYIKFSLLFSLLLVGCSSSPDNSPTTDQRLSSAQLLSDTPALNDFYVEWQGTPYRYGGNQKNGIDCSAFVQKAFVEAYQLTLPRTTKEQSKQGIKLDWQDARKGDLVFFKTKRTTYHVGIYLGDMQFMHASTSKGVIISRLDNPYWSSKFWQVRRVTL